MAARPSGCGAVFATRRAATSKDANASKRSAGALWSRPKGPQRYPPTAGELFPSAASRVATLAAHPTVLPQSITARSEREAGSEQRPPSGSRVAICVPPRFGAASHHSCAVFVLLYRVDTPPVAKRTRCRAPRSASTLPFRHRHGARHHGPERAEPQHRTARRREWSERAAASGPQLAHFSLQARFIEERGSVRGDRLGPLVRGGRTPRRGYGAPDPGLSECSREREPRERRLTGGGTGPCWSAVKPRDRRDDQCGVHPHSA